MSWHALQIRQNIFIPHFQSLCVLSEPARGGNFVCEQIIEAFLFLSVRRVSRCSCFVNGLALFPTLIEGGPASGKLARDASSCCPSRASPAIIARTRSRRCWLFSLLWEVAAPERAALLSGRPNCFHSGPAVVVLPPLGRPE